MPGMKTPPPEAFGIFTGFNIKYPEFTVVTPQMGYTFSVRCLTVSEVNRLKTSSTTPAKTTDLINRTLWDAIVARPEVIQSFDDFLKLTTLRDREALMYGLYITTFGDEREFRVGCSSCDTERTLKIKLSNMFSITPWPSSQAMINTYKMDVATGETTSEPDIDEIIRQQKIAEAEAATAKPKGATTDIDSPTSPDSDGIGLGGPAAVSKKKAGVAPVIKPVPITRPVPPGAASRMTAPTTPLGEGGLSPAGPAGGATVRVQQQDQVIGTILGIEIPVRLPISGITAILHQPKLIDEYEILNNVPFLQKKQTELINETLIIKRLEIYLETDTQPRQVINDRDDILRGYQSLPHLDKKAIYDKFRETFSEYGITLATNWECMSCGSENTMDVEIVTQFFRMVALS